MPPIQPATGVNQLLGSGFEIATAGVPHRLLVGSEGLERTGKTDWPLRSLPRAKGLVVYIGLDIGHEGVIEKYSEDKRILKWTCNVPNLASQDKYIDYWKKTRDHIHMAMENTDVQSIILDTGTDVWELLRLAEFGQLTKSGDTKQLYQVINQAYKSLIRKAYDREINLVVIHKQKKLYEVRRVTTNKGVVDQEYWAGRHERAGFGEGGYLVQIQIEHLFDNQKHGKDETLENHFGIRVKDCRQNMNIRGLELWGPENNFRTLATYVFPDTVEDDWL